MFGKLTAIQAGLAGVAVGGLGAFLITSQVWWKRGYDAADLKASAVIASKNDELKTRADNLASAESDISQCQTVNAGYHKAVADQIADASAKLQAQADAVIAATKTNAAADKRMESSAELSAKQFEAVREAVRHAVDQCVIDNMPADFVRMLNSGINPTAAAGSAANVASFSSADNR